MCNYSKRHYEAVAQVFHECFPKEAKSNEEMQGMIKMRHILMKRFGVMFTDDNPRFQVDKFMKACGV